MLQIEFEPAVVGEPCACCGGQTTRLTRFVTQDGTAFAVYYAVFSDNHPQRFVTALISLGNWGTDSTPVGRCSFCVQIRADSQNYLVGLQNADNSPWGEVSLLGRTLDRHEALQHPRIQDVFHITDQIVLEDIPVIRYLHGSDTGQDPC